MHLIDGERRAGRMADCASFRPASVVFASACEAVGRFDMASGAGRSDRLDRVDRTLADRSPAFSPIGRFCSLPLTWHSEQFASVGGRAGGAHRREQRPLKVVVASAEAHHDVGCDWPPAC